MPYFTLYLCFQLLVEIPENNLFVQCTHMAFNSKYKCMYVCLYLFIYINVYDIKWIFHVFIHLEGPITFGVKLCYPTASRFTLNTLFFCLLSFWHKPEGKIQYLNCLIETEIK